MNKLIAVVVLALAGCASPGQVGLDLKRGDGMSQAEVQALREGGLWREGGKPYLVQVAEWRAARDLDPDTDPTWTELEALVDEIIEREKRALAEEMAGPVREAILRRAQ